MASVSENVRQIDSSKCRICMFPKPNLSSLFRRGLSMKVMKLAEIKMYEGDGLPSTICLDCEVEVNRCVNFIAQIQRADAKLREMLENGSLFTEEFESDKEFEEREQEASTSQIEIEEFNVKQEMVLDNYLDEKTDANCESDHDHDHFEASIKKNQPEDEAELNPLNHVDVVEDTNRADAMDVPVDPLGQEEPLIESQKIESDPSVDPLTFMKQEAVSMDIDKNSPQPCGSSSTVRRSVASMSFTIWPQILNSNETRYGVTTYPQQYNVLLTKQNMISNADPQRTASPTATITGNSIKSTNSIENVQKPYSDTSRLKTVLPEKSVINSQTTPTSVIVKKVKERKLKDLIEDCRKKWRQNVNFCLACNLDCSSVDLLEEHKDKESFICRICTVEFKNHADLETHFFTHKPVKCDFCQEIAFCRKDLLRHKKKMHQNIRFQCEICSKTFARRRTLKAHKIVKHSSSNSISFNCVVCEKTMSTRSLLHNHLLRVHNAFEFQECKFCKSLFPGPDNLKTHIKAKHLDYEINTLLGCKLCGKIFKGVHNLSQHEATHDDTECLCELCGQSVKGKSAMKTHMNLKHSKKRSFSCKYCTEQFLVRLELKKHYKKCPKKVRTVPDPFFCEICGKQYKSFTILKMHKKIHCEERPYKCEECGASFRQAVTLKTHSRVHSSFGKYCCDDCGMTFKWKQTYDNHVNKCMATNQHPKEKHSE